MEVRKELTDEWITGGIEPCRKTYKLYKSLLEDVNNDGIQDGLVVIDKDFDCFLPNEDTQILYYVI
jgi:hypothetical protein